MGVYILMVVERHTLCSEIILHASIHLMILKTIQIKGRISKLMVSNNINEV